MKYMILFGIGMLIVFLTFKTSISLEKKVEWERNKSVAREFALFLAQIPYQDNYVFPTREQLIQMPGAAAYFDEIVYLPPDLRSLKNVRNSRRFVAWSYGKNPSNDGRLFVMENFNIHTALDRDIDWVKQELKP
ncbi:hypothetical protein WJU23_18590 [Prosthecobacter sp. SYSU 5D2]|uniref:hypothetical protein n=1 Tax=Prosthecobacter sp. SYSU 5D2 TaxID=3134134 RepID=UPI0031FEB6E6